MWTEDGWIEDREFDVGSGYTTVGAGRKSKRKHKNPMGFHHPLPRKPKAPKVRMGF